jgi:hypothetical protein
MTRSMVRGSAIAALAVSAALLFVGCSSSVDGPPDSSSASSTSTSTVAATTSPPSPSTQVVPSTSVTSSTPSTASATSANPLPPDLTPDQITQARAAIAAYVGYSALVDRAYADPNKDWSAEAAQWATDPAKSSLLQNLAGTAALGQHTSGSIELNPTVTKVEPGLITIKDCVDSTNTDFFDSTGRSIKAPDVPGSYFRHISEVQVALYETGQWLVTFITDDYNTTC